MKETVMKIRANLFCLMAAAAVLSVVFVCQAQPAKTNSPTPTRAANVAPTNSEIPKSVFIIPTNPKEGRDPFFPNSVHLWGGITITESNTPVYNLVYNGSSGTTDRPLAMINGRTFAVGETGEVITSAGRTTIRCIQIKDDAVTVEVGGKTNELRRRLDH